MLRNSQQSGEREGSQRDDECGEQESETLGHAMRRRKEKGEKSRAGRDRAEEEHAASAEWAAYCEPGGRKRTGWQAPRSPGKERQII